MISQEERHGNLTFVTVSDIGSNHRVLCIPNQDAAGFECVGNDFVMVVSDGVGSCKEAEAGSKYVVDAVIKLFHDLSESVLYYDNHQLAEIIISSWKSFIGDNPIDEYCATIKAVIKLGNTVKIISLGDGIAAITSDGMSLVSPTEETAFANETKCMSSFVLPKNIWIGEFKLDTYVPYTVFCCTDGIANGLVSGRELDLVNEIEQNTSIDVLKEELQNLVNEIGEYGFDDRTLGVVKYERKN